MPVRTIRNETDGTFAYGGSWTALTGSTLWGTTPTTPASSGTVKYTVANGATCTITLPANHGFTGGVIIGHGQSTNTTNASITVDGAVVQAAWRQKYGTNPTPFAQYTLPRLLSLPFLLNPAKGSTQVIVITAGSDGGNTVIDGIELYTAAAPAAPPRLVRFGHSMEYPVIDSNTLGPNANGHGQKLVAYFNAMKYLGSSAWVDVNQAAPSAYLSGGSVNSGLAGGPNSAGAYPQFTEQTFYDNTAILTPDWMRAEAGDLWPNTGGHAPRLGIGLFTTDAHYMVGVPQAWAQAGSFYLFFHNVNDVGLSLLYDNPADGVVANGASALQQIQTCTPSGAVTGNLNFLWNGNTSILCATSNNVAGIQACLDGATPNPIPFTVSGAAGSPIGVGGAGVTFTNKTYGATVASITNNYAGAGTETMATTQAGRAKSAAGAGYALDRFTQRFREFLIRLALSITPCPRTAIIGHPNTANGLPEQFAPNMTPAILALIQSYDAAMQAVLDEPWIPAITGGQPFFFVPMMGATTGFASNVSSADAHPSDAGHSAIFNEIRRRHEQTLSTSVVPTSSMRSY